jgi:hypothetical protein
MFNYNKKKLSFEYPLPKDLFVNFLMGKEERFPSEYFDRINNLVEDYDKISTGESHRDFYEANYLFYIKLLQEILSRFESVFDRTAKFDHFKNGIFEVLENEKFTNPNLIVDGSLIFAGTGKINSYSRSLNLIKDSLQKYHNHYYAMRVHELEGKKTKAEINKIGDFVHNIIKELNKITKEIKVISDNLMNFLVSLIKAKFLKEKDIIHKKILESALDPNAHNPNEALAKNKYELGFNNSIHESFVLKIDAFKSKVNSNLKGLPNVLCSEDNKVFSNQLLINGFNTYISGLIQGSLQTNYFNVFTKLYNENQKKAA